jgi:sugar-phosphatase
VIVTPLPGAPELLAGLPPGSWAIVTSGNYELARATLTKARLPWPQLLVTADDVTHGKPDPEPYLTAAHRAGVAPQRCVVIEDSIAGVAAGHAAGAQVLALAATHPAAELVEASWVIDDLAHIRVACGADGIELRITDPRQDQTARQ